jgi:hypothetical protein
MLLGSHSNSLVSHSRKSASLNGPIRSELSEDSQVAILTPRNVTDAFLTQGLGRKGSQELLTRYLAKCADVKTRPSALQSIHRLAKTAWGSATPGCYETRKVNRALVHLTMETAINLREYTLFNSIMGWLDAESIIEDILTLIGDSIDAGTLEFGEIKARSVP